MPRMRLERAPAAPSLLRMGTSKKYRAFAEDCERLAGQVRDERHRKVLQEMAAVWRLLAADASKAERDENGVG